MGQALGRVVGSKGSGSITGHLRTTTLQVSFFFPTFAVILASPAFRAVTRPFLLTLAIRLLELDQVTSRFVPDTFSLKVSPAHSRILLLFSLTFDAACAEGITPAPAGNTASAIRPTASARQTIAISFPKTFTGHSLLLNALNRGASHRRPHVGISISHFHPQIKAAAETARQKPPLSPVKNSPNRVTGACLPPDFRGIIMLV